MRANWNRAKWSRFSVGCKVGVHAMANEQDKSVISVSPEEGLEECRGGKYIGSEESSSDEAGAVAVAQLRARVEQQSSLIAILKQRNDETFRELSQCRSLSERNTAHNLELRETLSQVSRAKSVLEQRFQTLSSNHEQLTRIMEEHKEENRKLHAELDLKNREKESVELEERERQLLALRELVAGRDERARLLEGRCSILEEEIKELQAGQREREERLTGRLGRQKQEQRAVEQTLTETEEKLENVGRELTELRKCNKELQMSLRKNDASLKEKSLESNRLQLEIRKLQLEKQALAQDMEQLSVELSVDVQVCRLERELKDERRKREELQKEYLAYQKHSSELLRKEQELNNKLRHFSDL